MKTLISTLAAFFLLAFPIMGSDDFSAKAKVFVFPTNSIEPDHDAATNCMTLGVNVLEPVANVAEILKTNGLECEVRLGRDQALPYDSNEKPPRLMSPPICFVTVFNHTTNDMSFLNLSETNVCRIALLDKQGKEVKKKPFGKMFGLPFSLLQINEWFARKLNQHNSHVSPFVEIFPNPSGEDILQLDLCGYFSLYDAFEITQDGEYELHLQVRLIQVGKDTSGKFHFPVTWLPEVVVKFTIP